LLIADEDSDRITLIQHQVNRAHKRLVADLGLLQKKANLNLIAGDENVSLPFDWYRTRVLRRGTTVLREVSFQEMGALDLPASSDLVYAMKGVGEIILRPVPGESVTGALELWYDAYPEAMATGSDEPEGVPEAYHEIIPETVIAKVAAAEEEPMLAQIALQFANEMAGELRSIVNRRGGQRPVQQPVRGLRPY
jgi:hypothetical protein